MPRYARCGGQEHREDKPAGSRIRLVFMMLLPTTTPAEGRRTTGSIFSVRLRFLRVSVLVSSRVLRALGLVSGHQRWPTNAKAMMLEPDATAMCCLPSNTYVIGDAFHVEFV